MKEKRDLTEAMHPVVLLLTTFLIFDRIQKVEVVSVFFTNNAEKQDADDKFDLNPSHAALYVSTDSVLEVFLDPYWFDFERHSS